MRVLRRSSLAVAALLVACCGGGSSVDGVTSSSAAPPIASPPEATASAAGTAAVSASATPTPAFAVDVEVVALLRAMAKECDVDVAHASVKRCRGNQDATLARYVEEKRPTALYGTAATLAAGEGGVDKKLFAVALHALRIRLSDAAFVESNATVGAADAIAKLAPLVPDAMDVYFAEPAAAVMLLAGRRTELTTLLASPTVKRRVARRVWTYYLAYGGADAIADVRAALAIDDARANAASAAAVALAPPSRLGPDDRAKVCDLAKEMLARGDDGTLGPAMDALAECGGPYSDAALDALTARTAGPVIPAGIVDGAYHQCWSRGVVGGAVNGTPAQCARALDALEAITRIPTLDAPTLAAALWAIGHVGKNGGADTVKRSKAILARFVTHKDKSVQERARADYGK